MATFDIIMPKMGESVQEATITKWFKKVGDKVEEEDVLLEIATDKVDSEIPSPVDGVITKILFEENAVVPVGDIIAIIDLDGDAPIAEEKKEAAKEGKTLPDKKTEPEKKTDTSKTDLSGTFKSHSQHYSIGVQPNAGEASGHLHFRSCDKHCDCC